MLFTNFRISTRTTNYQSSINGAYSSKQKETIREVTHAKYLGVTIDQHLFWSEHIKQITNKANRVKSFLQRNLHSCPPQIKSNCYKALVKPILEYPSIIWAPHTQKDIRVLKGMQLVLFTTIIPTMPVLVRYAKVP